MVVDNRIADDRNKETVDKIFICLCLCLVTDGTNLKAYYMALSHEDWELPNSRIWLAEIDIDRGLDFPI